MTRREFCATLSAALVPAASRSQLTIPIRIVIDSRTNARPDLIRRFWSRIWPQAAGNFFNCGIRLQPTVITGEVRRSAGGYPIFVGLDRAVLNLVITDHLPPRWDSGRALAGVTTRYQEYFVCMVALDYAHGHQIPFVSVNTCLHELLHAFLQDIFEGRPSGLAGNAREFRVDWYATRMWLFHDGAHVRKSARGYLDRLRAEVAART